MDVEEPPRVRLRGDAVAPSLGINTASQPGRPGLDDDGGERGDADVQPPLRSRKRSLKVERLRSNLDEFASHLASIRAKVAARSLSDRDGRAVDARLPVIDAKTDDATRSVGFHARTTDSTAEQLRLPLLRRIHQATQQKIPPRDPFVTMDSIARREAQQDKLRGDSSELAAQEQVAAAALQHANRLDEQVRVATVAFSKSERSWAFDERARRYRELLDLRKQAEEARAVADKESAKAQLQRSLLSDPYRGMRAMSSSPRTQLAPVEDTGYTWLWILASLMPTLPFTPREETLQAAIEGEKELSTHVVYYIAPSAYTDRPASSLSASEQEAARSEDRPPSDGWISCSHHGVSPAPGVTHMKSPIETWVVQGAGAGNVNGRYVLCGTHDLVRKFKSSTGVELFRKRVPVLSALAQSLYDRPSEPETPSSTGEATDYDGVGGVGGAHKPPSVLPSALRSIEKDEHNFRSMQRIGAWLGMNEENERFRRMKEEDAQTIEGPASEASSDSDGDTALTPKRSPTKITVQNERSVEPTSSADVAQARSESCAPICKEWVLFLKCTKREPTKHAAETTPQPQKPGMGCPYRHYYISAEEKAGMTIWAQGKEYLLEKSVLLAIIAREAHIKTAKRLCSECMTSYQQNLRNDTNAARAKLLMELNHIRLLSIKVLEKIETWRAHIRRLGFSRYDPAKDSSDGTAAGPATDPSAASSLLGWSATITLSTGKQLYKGSKAFVSRVKRFCRPEDATGKKELHIVYLGYFKTRMEAEQAYDEFAASEARRLNTTTTHLPRRRGVFRSCGKHFAVESERLGPSFCIECKTQALASSASSSPDDWTPPFYYTPGENYILRMADDLDFLDEVPPLKSLLNDGRGTGDREFFPLRGNAFLLPRDPVYDIGVLPLTSFATIETPESSTQPEHEEMLDRDRIANAQKVLLQELHVHHPNDAQALDPASSPLPTKQKLFSQASSATQLYRVVEALYWDRCAALQIRQQRPPLAFRQPSVWCRPDAGEWASLVARGAHQLHFIFETNLAAAGREMQKKRKGLLKVMRDALGTPLYLIHDRYAFLDLITAGQTLKGDVVQLEVNNLIKRLARYDAWCVSSGVVQRCFRKYMGRKRARMRLQALRQACSLRIAFMKTVHATARVFYEQNVVAVAVRRAARKISSPVYRCVIKKDGEMLVVSVHSLAHYRGPSLRDGDVRAASSSCNSLSSLCCSSCARRFRVKAMYECDRQSFSVIQGVCTCSANGGGYPVGERWLLRAYNPVSNVIYRAEIGNTMLSQLVTKPVHPCDAIDRDESSFMFGYCSPIQAMQRAQQTAITASVQASYNDKRAFRAYQELLSWKRLNSEAVQARKTASVVLENCIAAEEKTQSDFGMSIVSAKKAMNFTSRAFSEAQAWDPLENANDWKLLVDKRRLEKQLQECRQETERGRVACFQATYNELYTRVLVSQAQKRYDLGWLPMVERHYRAMEATAIKETTSRAVVECSIRRLCDELLSLREKGIPLRRQLMVQRPMCLGATAIRVALPELQRQRSCLRRRTLRLQNHEKADKNVAKRMIVSVFVLLRRGQATKNGANAWWVSAYDPTGCTTQEVFLEWEIARLLVGWRSSGAQQDDALLPRSTMQQIADRLLSIAMINRFTGEFTLRKLQFYQQMRLVRPQVFASKWFRDLQRGRKSGRGDEVLRQGTSICGRLGVVVVFENWGDLAFEFYHAATGRSYELVEPLLEMSRRLSRKPLLLRLWVSSVMSNVYAPAVFKQLLNLLEIEKRADADQAERLSMRSNDAKSWRKCFQGARTIQGRKVLVSVREDASRDFRVLAFDLNSGDSYVLEMEREALARMFKDSAARSGCDSQASLLPLLLRQNRRRLYEWIVNHLQFQNLMEHPATLSATLSPLAHGCHVRQSFQTLNRWVSSCERIPVASVSLREIDRLAAQSETSAISSLLFDQLALIPDANLPFGANKQLCGTLEWADVGGRPLLREAEHAFPFMKADVHVQAHNLMVRLRREVFAETEQRRQKAAQAELQREEAYSLAVAIQEALRSSHQRTRQVISDLETARAMIDSTVRHWAKVHAELVCSLRVDNTPVIPSVSFVDGDASPFGTSGRLEGIERLTKRVDPDLIASPHMFDILRSSVRSRASVPLSLVSSALRSCLSEMTCRVAERLQALISDYESTREDRSPQCLLRLQRLRFSAIDFDRDFFGLAEPPRSMTSTVASAASGCRIDSASETALDKQRDLTAVSQDGFAVRTALLIPENPSHDLQEIFLDVAGASCLLSRDAMRYEERISMLTSALEPMFSDQLASERRVSSSQVAELLAAHRVAGGLVVCQDPAAVGCKGRLQRNPRANAITGQTGIRGVAVYVPFSQPSSSGADLWHRLIHGSSTYAELVKTVTSTPSDPSLLSAGGTTALDKKRRIRSTKFLPWKQHASDRMRIARMFKRSLATCGRSVVEFPIDTREREDATVVTACVSFRQLESMTGRVLTGSASLEAMQGIRFVLSKAHRPPQTGLQTWRLDVASPLVLSGVLDNTVNRDGDPTRSLRGSSNAPIDLDALQIEVDDVEHPRRLVFSCRDLQSRRRYVVDCGYYDLYRQYQADTTSTSKALRDLWRRRPTTVQEWRALAQFAAQHLAFRTMNGAQTLCFDFAKRPESYQASPRAEHALAVEDVTQATISPPSERVAITNDHSKSLKDAIDRCCAQRLAAHQRAVVRFVATEQARTRRQLMLARRKEWVSMIIEDQRSQMLRGLLVLDIKTLTRVQAAYTNGTNRARKQKAKQKGGGGEYTQLMEICKDLGASADSVGGVQRELEAIQGERNQRRGQQRGGSASDEHVDTDAARDKEWPFVDVAEWWRRYLTQVAAEKAAAQQSITS